MKDQTVKIATIDTMLSFYLAFLYADRPYYNAFLDRILCMSKFLFEVQQKNRLEQKGLLKRFSVTCYGHQETVEEIRANKSKKYKELKASKNKEEFNEWFLNYKPEDKFGEKKELTDINKKIKTNKTPNKKTNKKTNKNKKIKSLFNFYGSKTRRNKKELY